METFFRRLFVLVFLLPFLLPDSYAQNADILLIRKNLIDDAVNKLGFLPRTERYVASDFSKAETYLKTMNANGSWQDVDYSDRDNNWSPLVHLDKILVMAINYSKSTSTLYQSNELLEGLEKSIQYWYTVNPVCDNWYKNEIAKQFYFNIIGLLLQGKIDDSLHSKIVNDLTIKPTMTGSNRTLLAISTFYRGVMENDPEMLKLGVDGVTDQIVVTTKEGIQPDYSFHQHGHFIYNGSYGSNFLRESIWMATMVHGTAFAYSEEQIGILRDYFFKGTRWMIRGGLFDYNVRGRQVGRGDAFLPYAEVLLPQLEHFMVADPNHRKEFEAARKHIENKTPQDFVGHKHFWRSDYTVHHRPGYFTSLKMCSKRTIGIELNMNSENKMGYWLPYGLTYIYRQGDEYSGIFPVWDWALLPGVTNPHVEIEEFRKGKAHTQETTFVGGVSDGEYGVSAMDFSKQNTTAKKAWFWFDDEWVALGTGIESSHEANVVTTVNQTLLKGNVLINGTQFTKDLEAIENPNWVFHDGVGYIFPAGGQVYVKVGPQSGNLKRIYGLGNDSIYTSNVFALWFEHGKKPKNETYEYIVVPGTSAEKLEKYKSNSPLEILSNTKEIQAVAHKELQVTGIVFYQAGEFMLNENLLFKVDKPSLLLVNQKTGMVSISDPTQELEEITITVENKQGNVGMTTVKLPDEGFAGSSVNVNDLFKTASPR